MSKNELKLRKVIRDIIQEINIDKFELPKDVEELDLDEKEEKKSNLNSLIDSEDDSDEVSHAKDYFKMREKQTKGKRIGEDEGVWPYNVHQQEANPQLAQRVYDSSGGESGAPTTARLEKEKIVKDDEGNEIVTTKKLRVQQSKELADLATGASLSRFKFEKSYGKLAGIVARIIVNKGLNDDEVLGFISSKYNEAQTTGKPFKLSAAGAPEKDIEPIDITKSIVLKKIANAFNSGKSDIEIVKELLKKPDPTDSSDDSSDASLEETKQVISKLIKEMLSTGDIAIPGGAIDEEEIKENEEDETEEVISEENIPNGYSLEGILTKSELVDLADNIIENEPFLNQEEVLNSIESITGKMLSDSDRDMLINIIYSVTGEEEIQDEFEEEIEEDVEPDAFSDYI